MEISVDNYFNHGESYNQQLLYSINMAEENSQDNITNNSKIFEGELEEYPNSLKGIEPINNEFFDSFSETSNINEFQNILLIKEFEDELENNIKDKKCSNQASENIIYFIKEKEGFTPNEYIDPIA